MADFENAPVGATATHPDGSRAMKMDGIERRWVASDGVPLDDEEVELLGYTRDPLWPAPESAREALDLAWNLAHPVKEGQHIPDVTRLLDRLDSNDFSVYTTKVGFVINAREALSIRTLDPLPDPEPDWLEAPAVLATCGCRGIELWQPHDEKVGMWVSASGEHVLWSTLRHVTPLWPKENEK